MLTREEFLAAKLRASEAQKQLSALRKKCTHVVEAKSESAYCSICETDFGWACDISPDKVCHYYSRNGFIDLLDGTKVPVEKDHDAEYETDDSCLFCGSPLERK